MTLRERLERPAPERSPSPSLLAVGGVDYWQREELAVEVESPLAAAETRRSLRSSFGQPWGPLPETRDEARAGADLLERFAGAGGSSLVLTGPEASEEALVRAARGRTVLHLATHGFFERAGIGSLWEAALRAAHEEEHLRAETLVPGAPLDAAAPPHAERPGKPLEGEPPELLAGLILAGANEPAPQDRSDGVLTAWDVAGLDLSSCELAVLSACETALGTGRSGEGVMSLRRAFREAGAQTVIATLWKVEDEATRILLARFYEKLWKDGLSPATALRAARLSLLREQRFAAPAFWGAFTLSGEWR